MYLETLPSFRRTSIILDPVMISTSGSKLLEDDAIRTIIDELFPKATLLTPNIPETEYLSGIKINNEADILCAARKLQEEGCNAILIKGGHIPGVETVDRLFINENNPICLASPTVGDLQYPWNGLYAIVRHRRLYGTRPFIGGSRTISQGIYE